MVLFPYLVRAGINRFIPYLLNRQQLGYFPGAARQLYRTKQLAYGGAAAIGGSLAYGTYKGVEKMRMKRSRNGRRIPVSLEGGFRNPPWKQSSRVNTNVPTGDLLKKGMNAIGDRAIYTHSTDKCKVVTGYRGRLGGACGNLYRWQSIRPYGVAGATEDTRSLHLDVTGVQHLVSPPDNTEVKDIYLPMYAFDLTTLPVQGYSANTKTGAQYESVPMYRLKKTCHDFSMTVVGPDASLDPNIHNYVWEAQNGMNNGPSKEYNDTSDYLWSNEVVSTSPQDFKKFKTNYVAVDILMKCSRIQACKVHVSVVKFKNHAGPYRYYCENQVHSGTENMTIGTGDVVDIKTLSDRDVFWESFWDNKVVHPLCDYKAPKRGQYVQFIKDKVFNIMPEAGTEEHPYTHKYSLVFKDGGIHNLYSPVYEDDVENTIQGQQPPVCGNEAAGTWEFGNAFGFNVINKADYHYRLYDPSDKERERTCYLLIWMEGLPGEYRPYVASTTKVTRPAGGSNALPQNPVCCSFDIRVRKHVSVTPSENIYTRG